MARPLQILLLGLSILALLGLTGCSAAGPRSASPATAPPAPAATAAPTAAAQEQARVFSAVELQAVYQLILERYVDRVDHDSLLAAARGALRESMTKAGALPVDSLQVDLLAATSADPDRDWAAFGIAYSAIVNKYRDWATQARPDIAVLHAMVDSLGDSHSSYIEADEAKRRAESSYTGIGIRLSKPGVGVPPVVIEVFPDSPAERAGLRPGDRLLSVGDQDVTGAQLADVADSIRGQAGTSVKLGIERGADKSRATLEVTRGELQIPAVEAKIASLGSSGPRIAYLRLRQFSEEVPQQAAEALNGMLTSGGARGIVLDLRGNGGGSLRAVATVAGFFVDPGKPIGLEIDRSRRRTPLNAQGQQPLRPLPPMAVLIDNGTSSGAEILAAALKEYGLATLVGEKTAGTVAVSEVQRLSDGSQVQLTVHRFLSPSGVQLDRAGVEPDEAVEMTLSDLEAGNDPQLRRALEIVAQKLSQ